MEVGSHGWHVHHPTQTRLLRTSHQQERRQVLEEYSSYPVGHLVGPWTSEVPVDDDDGREDGDAVHEEGEEQVLGDERQDEGRGRQDLGDEEQEDDQRQEDRYAQRNFFSCGSEDSRDIRGEEREQQD